MGAPTTLSPAFDVDAFVHEYYRAWSGTDEERILSYYADNVVLQLAGVLMEGKEAVRRQFVRPFLTAFPGNWHRVKNLTSGRGSAIVEFTFEAEHTGPFEGHPATGARVAVPGCGVYEYDAATRQITAARIYFDVGTLLRTITNFSAEDRCKAAEALQLNERNLSLIVNTIPTAAWTARPDGSCDFLNQRWLDYAGLTAEQAAGWGWAETIHPEDRVRVVEHWQSCLASGVPVETEARMRRFDGAYRWFLVRASPIREESGQIIKWCGTTIDIEDRKRVEDSLRASELSWRQIVDRIPGLVATTGAAGEVEFLNRQTLEYFGRTGEELKSWALIDAVHPEDLPRVIEARRHTIETGVIYDIEHRCRRADGVYRWFQVRGLPVRNAEDTITAWYLLLTDIEDRKRAEEALQASERSLSLTINTIPIFISVSRPDGSILSVNQAALDYHGIALEDVERGEHRTRFFHPDDVERVREVRNEALKHPRPFEYELRAMGKDGKYRWFSVRHSPLLDDQGRIERWYAISFDIEDRKETEEALGKSERQFRLLVETIPALVWRSTPEGDLDYLNHRAVEYLGHTAESLAGGRWLELVHPDHRDTTLQRWMQSAATGTVYQDEYRLRRADGQYRWVQSVGEPFLDTEGRIANWYGLVTDIEDRKRAEEALQANEHNLRLILNTIPTHIYVLNTEGAVQYVNQAVMDYTGLSLEDVTQSDYRDRVIHPEDFARVRAERSASLRLGAPFSTEQRVLANDGQYRWFLVRYKPLLDEQGRIVRWYVAAFDIEDRKQAEREVAKSESKLRHVIDAIPALAWCNLPDGPNEFLNKGWHEFTGLSEEESHGWGWQRAFHPDDLPPLMAKWLPMLTSGLPDEVEARLRRHDGVYRWFLIRAAPFRDESGEIVRWYGTSTDIDDRKRAEDAQARQALVRADVNAAFAKPSRLAEILRGCTEAIVRHLDAAFARIWMLNKDESMLELQASAGMYTRLDGTYSRIPVGDLKVGRIAREKKAHLTNDVLNDPRVFDRGWALENGMVAFAGYPLVVEDRLIGVVALFARHPLADSILDTLASVADTIAQGIERKRAEEALTRARAELAHMARVTTLSALTTSIAHEVNQPIAAVITSADACLRWLNRDQPQLQRVREAAMRIQDDGKRAAEIISHLKLFYRKDVSPQREPVPVNDVVGDMLVLLRSEADRHAVVMRTELAADLPSVRGDRVQLQQVLMNLMLNGMEAMHEGGALTIRTGREGGMVMVSVCDTGVGLPATEDDHIFNAFFTTKAGGTGMGLAISHTIIESHGGRIWATRNPKAGATFHFTLPAGAEA